MTDLKTLKRNLKQDLSQLPSLTMWLVGDSATQLLATALRGMGVERGYRIDLHEAEYNQVERQVMDPTSELHQQSAPYNVFFQSTHKLLEHYAHLPAERRAALADERIAFVRTLCAQVGGHIIYYNYPEIDDTVFGSYANKVEASFTYQLRKLNYELMRLASEMPNLYICDLAALQAKMGRDAMFDPAVYVSTEMLLSIDALPHVASRTLDVILAIEGKIKKCLILDLDGTLWGGVVGDDGWENVQIGHGLGIGKAFTEFQQWVKKLKDRGIIIAVCSKNDEDKAKEPFEKNPEMVLRLDDISTFVANWENKADNIRTIQRILNIGFDSMVFVDDNPFERNMVRQHIPGITVPELPDDPGQYLEYLYGLNLFETASYSAADRDRTRQYQIESQRVQAAQAFTDEGEFLKSLGMVSRVEGFTAYNIPRSAQLTQRSNQFNLRTVRYTEDQLRSIADSPDHEAFTFTLVDRFGDNGLICIIIVRRMDAATLFVDTWLMSCRVLKRGMEHFALNQVVAWAVAHGYTRLVGEYRPTPKNAMVSDHYPRLGFQPLADGEQASDGSSRFALDLATFQPRPCHIRPADTDHPADA